MRLIHRVCCVLVAGVGVMAAAPQVSAQAPPAECAYFAAVSASIRPDAAAQTTPTLVFSGYGNGSITVVVLDKTGAEVRRITGLSSTTSYTLTMPTTAGSYTIRVTGPNQCGTQVDSVLSVTVPPISNASLSAQPNVAPTALPASGGSSLPILRIGGLLVLCGVGFLSVVWRRRRDFAAVKVPG